ncbi:MAG: hypothetical protein IKK83_04885 [Clostridia bacterium]|nr:hypothetical protein [Clostridia bacterium]
MKRNMLVIGCANMDVLLNVPFAPNEGRVAVSREKYSFTPGGNGAYTAVAAARSEAEVVLCARVGDDEQGARLLRYLKDENVNTGYIAIDPVNQTGLEVYLLEQYGLGGKVIYKGASSKLNCANLEAALGCAPDLIVTDLNTDPEVLSAAASACRAREIPFVLDATGAYENVRLSGLRGDNIMIVGDKEFEILTGVKADSTENYLRGCIALCDRMPLRFVVLKLGRKGAYIYDGKYCELLMAPSLQTVDITAEHQTFVGAFCADFLRNYDVRSAAEYALSASVISASRVGGFASIPNSAEIGDLLDT